MVFLLILLTLVNFLGDLSVTARPCRAQSMFALIWDPEYHLLWIQDVLGSLDQRSVRGVSF